MNDSLEKAFQRILEQVSKREKMNNRALARNTVRVVKAIEFMKFATGSTQKTKQGSE